MTSSCTSRLRADGVALSKEADGENARLSAHTREDDSSLSTLAPRAPAAASSLASLAAFQPSRRYPAVSTLSPTALLTLFFTALPPPPRAAFIAHAHATSPVVNRRRHPRRHLRRNTERTLLVR